MDNKLQLIRGARILHQLNEVTYKELEQQTLHFDPATKKRQYATDLVRVVQLQLIPFRSQRDTGDIKVEAIVNSEGKKYETILYFSDVIFEDSDQPDNISFAGADGETYHMEPISLSRNNVKVRCNCLDFYFRFSARNRNKDALYGPVPKPYQARNPAYPSSNPKNVPGICKHIMKVIVGLRDMGAITN